MMYQFLLSFLISFVISAAIYTAFGRPDYKFGWAEFASAGLVNLLIGAGWYLSGLHEIVPFSILIGVFLGQDFVSLFLIPMDQKTRGG